MIFGRYGQVRLSYYNFITRTISFTLIRLRFENGDAIVCYA